MRDGEPWFVGKDVAVSLGHLNPERSIRKFVEDEDKGVTELVTPGGSQTMTIINEPGLYALVMSSKTEAAKGFKRWVTHDVLPSIRKTGMYLTEEAKRAMMSEVKEEVKAEVKDEVLKTIPKVHVIPAVDPAKLVTLLEHMRRNMIDAHADPHEIISVSTHVMKQFGIDVPYDYMKFWREQTQDDGPGRLKLVDFFQ